MKTEIDLTVRRPAEEVWDYFMDLNKVPEWSSAVLEARQEDEGPPRVGARVMHRVKMMGRTREVLYRVTEYEPARRLGMETVSGPMPMTLDMHLRPDGNVTRVNVHIEARPGGPLKLAQPLIQPAWRRAFEKDFQTAKEKIEAGA